MLPKWSKRKEVVEECCDQKNITRIPLSNFVQNCIIESNLQIWLDDMDHTEITREAKIEWLLLERYSTAPSEHIVGTAATEWLTTTTEEQKKFLDELCRLGDDELHTMFIERFSFRAHDAERRRKTSEAVLFYNKPGAFADYEFWSRQIVWTIEETIALSLNRNPKVVNLESLTREDNWSSDAMFTNEYKARLEIARSFCRVGQLAEEATPGEMLAWLDRVRVGYPESLAEAVQRMGHRIADWRSECEVLQTQLHAASAQIEQLSKYNLHWQEQCAELVRAHEIERAEWAQTVHELERQKSVETSMEKETAELQPQEANQTSLVDVRRYNSALRIALGMAKDKFSYGADGQQGKSAAANIESALMRSGIEVSAKTIRSILKDASDLLLAARKLPSEIGK